MALNVSQFKFRRHDSIGSEAAEADTEYLQACFVDTGDLAALRDTGSPRRIVVGRTGSGKTALLLLLGKVESHVSAIEPDQLALHYLSNSTILRHLDHLGVNLDLFYRLLWRHIFTVELIQLKYGLRSEDDQQGFFVKLRELLKGDKKKNEAVQYLEDWGRHFWRDTEYRIHEVTEKFESDIRAKLGSRMDLLEASIGSGEKVSSEERKEIVHRAQEVVDSVQIQKLSHVIDLLQEQVFDDPQQKYFVVIDRLDENWAPDSFRFKLIRALIEAVRDLQRIQGTKIVVALRKDLLQRVFRETRDAGFQEEKYQALYLSLSWTQENLLAVMDKRLNHLISRRYSGMPITWKEIFPPRIGSTPTGDYLVERTLYRPRDLVQFANCCIDRATDRTDISGQIVKEAESQYSTLRFRSLGDEWAADYPELLAVAEILKRRPPSFAVADIAQDQIDAFCITDLASEKISRLRDNFALYYNGEIPFQEVRARLVKTFYEVGMIGLRTEATQPISWSFRERDVLRVAEITDQTKVHIAPVFYRVLGTDLREP